MSVTVALEHYAAHQRIHVTLERCVRCRNDLLFDMQARVRA